MYGPVQVISPFTNRSKSGGKSEPFRNACKNFLDCAAAAGPSIPLFRRQQKAGSLCFWAQTASLSLSLMLPRRGTLCARKAGWTPTQPLSAAQRYNTLDFGSKVVCHETPGRFLWILPARTAPKPSFFPWSGFSRSGVVLGLGHPEGVILAALIGQQGVMGPLLDHLAMVKDCNLVAEPAGGQPVADVDGGFV